MKNTVLWAALLCLVLLTPRVRAMPGTEGQSFLDIPAGGRPAAMGGAYGALADDVYATVFNPGGLGFLERNQAGAMHLSNPDSIPYDFAGLAIPLAPGSGLGLAVQSLRIQGAAGLDVSAGPTTGDTSGSFTAYSLGYGRSIGGLFSIGAVGKALQAGIAGYHANAWAADLGTLYRPSAGVNFSLVAANLGKDRMTFLQEGTPTPPSYRAGAGFGPFSGLTLALQGGWTEGGFWSGQAGMEWALGEVLSIRGGYRTDTARKDESGTSSGSGLSAGVGLRLGGQQFDYTWVPMGDLGNTQYFSFVLQWGAPKTYRPRSEEEREDRKFFRRLDKAEENANRAYPTRTFSVPEPRGLHP